MGWNPLSKLFHRTFSLLSKIWPRGSERRSIVEPHESITRFILKADHFTTDRVKWNAFQPYDNPASRRLETSVYREVRLNSADLWILGRKYVENPQAHRLIKAR